MTLSTLKGSSQSLDGMVEGKESLDNETPEFYYLGSQITITLRKETVWNVRKIRENERWLLGVLDLPTGTKTSHPRIKP